MAFTKTYTIFGIHINNVKEDYANAFQFVKYGKAAFTTMEETNWIEEHIFFKTKEIKISNNENIYKDIIKDYEQWFSKQDSQIAPDWNSASASKDSFFYFRVKSNNDDDIINLHNFFLGSKICPEHCCLGIIADEEGMHFKISDYLFFEVYFAKENNNIKIIRKNSKKTGNCKYQLELINNKPVNVFLLKGNSQGFFPISIHKKGVNSSGTFFPQMKIDRSFYFAFSQNANCFCKKVLNYKVDEKYEQYSNDLLLNIALLNNIVLPIQTEEIEKILNKPFKFEKENIIESILILYCTRCIKFIISDKSSEKRKNLLTKINNFLNAEADNSTILAICFFLSYLSRIKRDDKISTEWIDILTDAQDYASGTLQLIENVIRHVPGEEGIFCFRLHRCLDNDDKSANARLMKKYSIIDEKSSGFYIEILVSDFNEKFDIPQKFIDNIKKNSKIPEDEREYYVSESLLESVSKFRLMDLFDYQNSQNTEQVWKNFYSHPQNLIAHYGLLVFEHLVKFAHGSFHVFSSNEFAVNESQYYESEKNSNKKNYIHIPGTQYEILLPIGVSRTPLETGLVQEVEYDCSVKTSQIISIGEENYELLLNEQFESFYKSSNRSRTPYWKSRTAIEISENIIDAICKKIKNNSPEESLFTFNVEKITNMTSSEVFVKALIRVIFSENTLAAKRFAFIKASEVFLTTFIRFFSIIYMKSRQSNQMDGRLIYLCSSSMSDEVYFSGKSIRNSLAITRKAVFDETGKVTHGLQVLRREAEKSNESESTKLESFQNIQQMIRPFFKQRALKALNSDIQHEGFGCCMHETHMRIGSKVHINGNYYEASLLFGFSGYVSNFALYVAENIVDLIKQQTSKYKKLVIVGYETYSENLAIRIKLNLQKLLSKRRFTIDYIIYNESLSENKFYRWNLVKPDKTTKFIVVVPIGSTLTTHDKVVADLLRTDFEETNHEKPHISSIVAHYVLVLVRDSMKNRKKRTDMSNTEKIFWKEIIEVSDSDSDVASDSNNSIVIIYRKEMSDIGADNKINCYLDVETNWYLPNECPYCFPKQDNLVLEKPLILSNRSSVVPMTKIGKSEEFNNVESEKIFDLLGTSITDDIDNMRPLYDALCYGHVVRDGDNHFEYYFQTEKIMESLMKKESKTLKNRLRDWSSKFKSQRSSDIIYYDYVVAPIHNTNANFVNYVSQNLHTKQIIWIDTKKDFRDNIIAKYSNLNSLYHNCCNQRDKVEIRFHYVDDTINSGDSFVRAKSLISSIFTEIENENENVKIDVFHSVFLLLNRCSFNTKKNFVDNPEQNFHSVFDLNISYMRSYSDACVPCKNESNLSKVIPMCSATSNVAVLSLKKSQRFQKREAEKLDDSSHMIPIGDIEKNTSTTADIDKLRNRYYYRMIITHRLNNVLKKLKKSMNNKDVVERYIWLQIDEILGIEDTNLRIDLLISLLKVISRPFLSFRKSVSESAMKIIIAISEYVILKNEIHISNCCTLERFKELLKSTENKLLFVKVLFSCLARLRSTFLLRSCTLKEILIMCDDIDKNVIYPDKFIELYIFYIKSMLCLSEKNSLSFWIENMVTENKLCEFSSNGNTWLKDSEVVDLNNYTYGKTVRNMLKIENITPIRDALIQCYKQWQRKKFNTGEQIYVINETLGHYYCRSYCEFSGIDKRKDRKQFDCHCQSVFSPMLSLYHHLSQSGDTLRDGIKETEYYTRLLNLVKEILGAEIAELFTRIPPNSTEDGLKNGELFLLFSTLYTQQNTSQKSDFTKFLEKIISVNDTSYICIGETLYLEKSENSNRIGAIKIFNTSSTDSKSKDFVYFIVFNWNTNLDDIEIISKVRNLLSMRSMLMKRIVKDFDNHIRNEFIMLRDKVKNLSIDRSGSHSPFGELSDVFIETNQIIQKVNDSCEENRVYARYLKLIADSVISKLYVHSIAKTFPKNFAPEDYQICDIDHCDAIPLRQFEKMFDLLRSSGKIITDRGSTKIPTKDSYIDKKINSLILFSPNNCGYIWCCAFIALYYNAVNHGYAERNNEGEEEVAIEVGVKDDFIYFKNRAKDNSFDENKPVRQSSQVTIEALKYFFDNYYKEGLFKHSIDLINGVKYYTVMIPLGRSLVEWEDDDD